MKASRRMSNEGGRIGRSVPADNGHQVDTFCRTVIAAVAAMLAMRLCEYLRRLIGNSGL